MSCFRPLSGRPQEKGGADREGKEAEGAGGCIGVSVFERRNHLLEYLQQNTGSTTSLHLMQTIPEVPLCLLEV